MAVLSRCIGTQNAHPAAAGLLATLRLALEPDPEF
jgi:hypothetical protein